MGAKELFDAGSLQPAIDQLTQDVKASPRELRSRIFLFELLCFAGDLQRAERQLDAITQLSGDVNVELGAQIYQRALKAEKSREAFFTGAQRQPKFLSEPPPYTALHLEAISKLRENRLSELETLLKKSEALRAHCRGRVDDQPFDDLRDYDDLMAPFLEVFSDQDYVWIPFEQISQLEIQPPRTLRDLLWIPANVALHQRPLGQVFLPAQYFGSSRHPDDLVKLGRMTDWKAVGEGVFLGAGQRTLLVDDRECPLLEIRKIDFVPCH